jgi:hypothetical protein
MHPVRVMFTLVRTSYGVAMGRRPRTAWLSLGAAAGLAGAVGVYDLLFTQRLGASSAPLSNVGDATRLLAAALSAGLLLGSGQLLVLGRGDRSTSPRAMGDRVEGEATRTSAWVVLLLAGFVGAVLAVSPTQYSRLAVEDGLVENASAAASLAGGVVLAAVVWRRSQPPLLQATLLVAAAALIVLAGEELSWGQRLAGFETPTALSGNEQQEFNVHNLATDKVEVLFYSCAGGVLVILPWLRRVLQWPPAGPWSALVPTPVIAAAAAPALGMNYDLVNSLPLQLVFWSGLGVLVLMATDRQSGSSTRSVIAVSALLLIAVQLVHLRQGPSFARVWDATEYRELFIALALSAWALGIRRHLADASPTGVGALTSRSEERL